MRFSRSAVRAIFQNVFVMGLLPAALLAGCGAPPPESSPGVQVSEGSGLVGFGAAQGAYGGGGGVPGSVPPGEGENPVEPAGDGEDAPADFPEDGGTGEFLPGELDADEEEPDFSEDPQDTVSEEEDAEDEGPSGPVAYECDPGDEEECVTTCGSIGIMYCGKLWGPCIPPEEVCNGADDNCDGVVDEDLLNSCGCDDLPGEVCNGLDDDCDGLTDEGVVNACGGCGPVPSEVCNGFDDDCDGAVDEGLTNACGGCGPVPQEVCNGLDDDCDGKVDEQVKNACGYCGTLPAEVCNGVDDDCDGKVDEGVKNACGACGPTNDQELCNGIDDDCDGQVDEACFCEVQVQLNGDCLTVKCPNKCPYPVGCDVDFDGDDPRGCIASKADEKSVYFQEGNNCGSGSVSGILMCSSVQGNGLNKNNCKMNKKDKFYVSKPSKCPDTN